MAGVPRAVGGARGEQPRPHPRAARPPPSLRTQRRPAAHAPRPPEPGMAAPRGGRRGSPLRPRRLRVHPVLLAGQGRRSRGRRCADQLLLRHPVRLPSDDRRRRRGQGGDPHGPTRSLPTRGPPRRRGRRSTPPTDECSLASAACGSPLSETDAAPGSDHDRTGPRARRVVIVGRRTGTASSVLHRRW